METRENAAVLRGQSCRGAFHLHPAPPRKVQCNILPSDGKVAMGMVGHGHRGARGWLWGQMVLWCKKGVKICLAKGQMLSCTTLGDALSLGKAEWELWECNRSRSCFTV